MNKIVVKNLRSPQTDSKGGRKVFLLTGVAEGGKLYSNLECTEDVYRALIEQGCGMMRDRFFILHVDESREQNKSPRQLVVDYDLVYDEQYNDTESDASDRKEMKHLKVAKKEPVGVEVIESPVWDHKAQKRNRLNLSDYQKVVELVRSGREFKPGEVVDGFKFVRTSDYEEGPGTVYSFVPPTKSVRQLFPQARTVV